MAYVVRGKVRNGPIPVVMAVIMKDGKVLLGQRKSRNKQWDRMWELPGGKVKFGETPQEALIREIQEETGLGIFPTKLLQTHTTIWHLPGEDRHVLLLGYSCEHISGSLKESKAHYQLEWFYPSEIPEKHLDGTKEIIEEALKIPQEYSEPTSEPSEDAFSGFAGIFG